MCWGGDLPLNERRGDPAGGRRGAGRAGWPHLLALAATAAFMAGAVNYVWQGGGDTDDFSECGNWFAVTTPPCYPNSNGTNGIIPYDSTPWSIDLTTETINDLIIEGSVDFGGSATLTLEGALLIDAGDDDVEINFGANAEIGN